MDELLAIGEFSARSGLSAKVLRSYAAAGLLVPAAVDPWSGYRYYAPGQLTEARLILALRQAGVPLSEIAAFLQDPGPDRLRRWGQDLDLEVASRRRALGEARALLGQLATIADSPPGQNGHRSSGSSGRCCRHGVTATQAPVSGSIRRSASLMAGRLPGPYAGSAG